MTPALLEGFLALWLFVLGLCIGSFLNVVIARVPHEQSIVRPGSRCPRCGYVLRWYDNVPLVSWLALRARCRQCHLPISWRYPAVELLTGLLFLACLARFGWDYPLAPALMLVTLLVPLTFIDLEHWILPFSLTLPGIALGLAMAVPEGLDGLRDAAIGAAVGFLLFWGLEWLGESVFKKEALGGGDKYLLALLGAFLGWQAIVGVIFLASLQGALIGSALLLVRGRAGPAAPAPAQDGEEDDGWTPGATSLPFGPWLALAGLEVLLLGAWLGARLPPPLALLVGGL